MIIEQPTAHLFAQLRHLLAELTPEVYSNPVVLFGGATIGQHVRHIIELYQTLLAGYEGGIINYDNRKRDLLLETCTEAAADALDAVLFALRKEDKPLEVCGTYNSATNMLTTTQSSYYREVVFNLEHATHHMALIKIAVQQSTAIQLPAGFGVAAASIRHQQSCAQ